jgi:hypothetical protein
MTKKKKRPSGIHRSLLLLLKAGPKTVLDLYSGVPHKGYQDLTKFWVNTIQPLVHEGHLSRLVAADSSSPMYQITPSGLTYLSTLEAWLHIQRPAHQDTTSIAQPRHPVHEGTLDDRSLSTWSVRESSEQFLEIQSLEGGKSVPRVRPAQIPSRMSHWPRNC